MSDRDWRDIPGYGGAYQISREGEVRSWRQRGACRSKAPRMMRQYMRKRARDGRKRFVKLTDVAGRSKDVSVLGIMAEVWFGGPRPGMIPYHRNGDLADHNVNNIGFITREKLGKMTGANSRRKPVAKVAPGGEIVALYPSARAAARANFICYQSVLDRCNGKVKRPFALDGFSYVFED